ncbi:hypothetical protein [Algiphilus aromaticivorans]|uniref:hypothetical protein n=1 Tax=Algiphilus aromaticivorans TaxID=382454 RepID=UPI0005C17376|nr:hypothetical protein [Algiphilus aromaticivorans]
MSFRLVYGDHELSVDLPFEPHVEDRVLALLSKRADSAVPDRAAVEFVQGLVTIVTDMIERSPLPPSEKQIQYALQIARTLNLELPAEVLQFREAMAAFLDEHSPEYRRRRAAERGALGSYPR